MTKRYRKRHTDGLCPCCRVLENRPGHGYCLPCHARYMREHRPKHSELSPAAKLKANARAYANVYLRRGKLTRQPCEHCGSTDSEMHHGDYAKPLAVHWLCRACHLAEHRVRHVEPIGQSLIGTFEETTESTGRTLA